jgi:hypothetical protein
MPNSHVFSGPTRTDPRLYDKTSSDQYVIWRMAAHPEYRDAMSHRNKYFTRTNEYKRSTKLLFFSARRKTPGFAPIGKTHEKAYQNTLIIMLINNFISEKDLSDSLIQQWHT